MAYLTIDDFKFGMDRRRERVAGIPGTLWSAKNIHITRGGDIERRKKFIAEYPLPAGTFGGAVLRGRVYAFGSADLAASMPLGVAYQRLVAPSSPAMVKVLDVDTFLGKFYVIAEYANGHVYHFYDGTRVTDWDIIGAAGGSFQAIAALLAQKIENNDAVTASAFGDTVTITANVPGTSFTIARTATDGGANTDEDITLTTLQANVAGVAEVRATADFEITGGSNDPGVNLIETITVNGVDILGAPVNWVTTNSTTALRVVAAINSNTATSGYTAEATGGIVTISAVPGVGAAANGLALVVDPDGDVLVTADAALAGGVTAVTAVPQISSAKLIGTFQAADTFILTINGTAYTVTGLASGTGRTGVIRHKRMFSPVGTLERYCMLERADVWDPASVVTDADAGFLDISADSGDSDDLVGAGAYQGLTAFFSRNSITLFQLDVDPALFAVSGSPLDNTGTRAPQSIVRYGNNDVFYLDPTGIRSLRARDSSNAPFVSDIGNAIDTYVQELVESLSRQQVNDAIAAIEPRDGRLWLVLGRTIIVLSYFPGAKITAWTYYDAEEFGDNAVQSVMRDGQTLYVRAGNAIFVYGGLRGDQYPDDDEIEAAAELPFLSAKTPATMKQLTGMDAAVTNEWYAEVAVDPNDPEKTVPIGRVRKITFNEGAYKLPGRTTMVAPKLVCSKAGPATISMLAIHYDGDKAE